MGEEKKNKKEFQFQSFGGFRNVYKGNASFKKMQGLTVNKTMQII